MSKCSCQGHPALVDHRRGGGTEVGIASLHLKLVAAAVAGIRDKDERIARYV